MKIAWFRPTPPDPSSPLDDSGAVIGALRATHALDTVDAQLAHDFVWMHARNPYDLCVYELDNTARHQFMWPYLLHYPGVLALRTTTLHDSRAAALAREQRHRDYEVEMAFSGASRRRVMPRWHIPRGRWPMLRVPLLASRLAVVSDIALVATLSQEYPGARVRYAPVGVREPSRGDTETWRIHDQENLRASAPPPFDEGSGRPVTFGMLDLTRAAAASRALRRAQAMGAGVELLVETDVSRVVREADVILALHWPSFGEPLTPALVGMAASKPVVVAETYATAAWPALDPQTWQPRGFPPGESPIVVSIDPRDEEHSLMLAMRRLSTDEALREMLGAAAHDWWKEHATLSHAAHAWEGIVQEAVSLRPPARPADWPQHLSADGTEPARAMLSEFGETVDFLR